MAAAKTESLAEKPHFAVTEPAPSGPSQLELAILWLLAAVVFVAVLTRFHPYLWQVDHFADNGEYMLAAKSITQWNLPAAAEVKQFWGSSYFMVPLLFLGLSARSSLLAISLAASLGSVWLVRRLWGPWIAVYFAFLNYAWLQMSFLGGSEPLCVFLILACFFAARRERWIAASVLAALATLVRPAAFFALPGIGLALLLRKDYKRAATCTLAASAIGVLYLLPFWIYFRDPLYQVHRYQQNDWQSGHAIGWPFHAIVLSLIHNREPWSNVLITTGWIVFATAGLILIVRDLHRGELDRRSNEWLFAVLYVWFLLSYDSVRWARAEFARFVLPAMPLLLFAFRRWLPKSRAVAYSLCVVSSILGAFSAVGLRNVISALHR